MRPPVPPVDPWGQHEPVQLQDPPNPLAVVPGTKGPIHHSDSLVEWRGPLGGLRDRLPRSRGLAYLASPRSLTGADIRTLR
jgi:hypothetical protein